MAFCVRTITTTLAGFGLWVSKQRTHTGVEIIRRDDYNDKEAEQQIADALLRFSLLDEKHVNEARVSAYEIAETALWEHLYKAYEDAYSDAIESSIVRTNRAVLDDGGAKTEQINFVRQQLFVEKPNWNRMMVDKTLPNDCAPSRSSRATSGGAGTRAPATCARTSPRRSGPSASATRSSSSTS